MSRHKWRLQDNPTDPHGMLWVCEQCGCSVGWSDNIRKKRPSRRFMKQRRPGDRQKPDCHKTIIEKVMQS